MPPSRPQEHNPKFKPQLYDLEADLAEIANLVAQHADIVTQLTTQLAAATSAGHTR